MSYQDELAKAEEYIARLAPNIPAISDAVQARLVMEDMAFWERWHHGQPGLNITRGCSVRYGWCFTHMDRAIKPRPTGVSVGPLSVDAHPGPTWGTGVYTYEAVIGDGE